MRVALVAEHFDVGFGGLERWTCALARHLVARGHAVHVVTFGGTAQEGIRLHRAEPAATAFGRARALDRALAAIPGCVVHDTGLSRSGDVYHPQTGSRLASLDREIATFPWMRRWKAAVSPRTQRQRLMLAVLERAQLRRARRVIVVSDRVRALLLARGAAPAGLRIVRNGTDPARFAPARLAALRGPERRRLAVAEDAVVFLSVAHNLRLKGADTALRALARLRASSPTARLIVAGGEPGPDLVALGRRLGLAGAVEFAGYVPDIERLYAAADVFVHPSRWDACSVATVEALASRLPVVTTRFDGAADFVRPGETGYVLDDPEDVAALAQAMCTLAEPERRAGFRAALGGDPPDLAQDFAAIEAVLAEVAAERGFWA